MFGTKENQRLYLPAWEYNCARMLGELAKIVENNGGDVASYRHIMANNRTYEPDAEPKQIYGQSWIKFILDGVHYYFEFNDNPFMEHHYTKRKVTDGKVLRTVYAEELKREAWMYDCLFRTACDADIREIANIVFNELVKAPMSKVYTEKHRRKVANTYDGGWHWEYVTTPYRYDDAKERW